MRRHSKTLVAAALSAGLLLFAGCGDDSGGGDNSDPVASFNFTPNCTTSSTDEVSFMSTSSDPDGNTLTCNWTFSQGTPGASNICNPTGVTFPNQNPYTVTLIVNDGQGGMDSTSMNVEPCQAAN